MPVLLLAVHRPGSHLRTLIAEVRDAMPATDIVVVDDGSEHPPDVDCTVLRHHVNRGKGAALKTGFLHILDSGSDVICADADGQHSVDDIVRVADRLRETRRITLGVRRIGPDMPFRSRFGNTVTQALFRAATGCPVQDTQTGLRGYPGSLVSWLLSVPGERFEYEMNVLLEAARTERPFEQVEIATTYLDGNASSHFGVFSDAVRIYRPLMRQAAVRPFDFGPSRTISPLPSAHGPLDDPDEPRVRGADRPARL